MVVVKEKDVEGVEASRVLWPPPKDAGPSAVSTQPSGVSASSDFAGRAVSTSFRWGILVIAVCAVAVVAFLIVGSILSSQ